ncbi:MarR family transcriptional regulator [Nonomuraea angiospora]|uniref:helix-turn-helix domain-containing protein n=1 Tax=Nonomuraea angiospora TaxID=46172 RepID=UPI0029BA4E1A|nr:MarR family transcriptional regulator [Nonomuraea angiospora]MDX3104235.1 MarR family transcriptional regulator [Nonomuraea angiospora]
MDKPIGHWLKQLDNLLEDAMDQALQTTTRREWQVLNRAAQESADAMPFTGVDEAVERLTAKGWLADGELTDAGRAAHGEISEKVGQFRQQVLEGVSSQEYLATVDVLRRMSANLTK